MKPNKRQPKDTANVEPSTKVEVRYSLNEKALFLAGLAPEDVKLYRQGAATKGNGKDWRATGVDRKNTRAGALAVVYSVCGAKFTEDQAIAALRKAKDNDGLNLGTGSPKSYVKAFIANGYFAKAI